VVSAGKVDKSSLISAVDLLPTLAHIAGAELPIDYESDGENIVGAFKGESFERVKPIYWVWPPSAKGSEPNSPNWPHLGYQSGGWKLLINPAMQKTELYRVSDDWYETNDVSSEYPDVTAQLINELHVLRSGFPENPASHTLSKLRGHGPVSH
jgi:N-acetylgalactosamine-6-sulfatase